MHEKLIARPVIEPANDMTALENLPGIGSGPTAAPGPPIPVLGVDNVLFSPLGDLALQRGEAERPLPPVRLAECTPSAMGLPGSAQFYPDAVWPVVLCDRPDDVLRFAHDLQVPPTSNQAERDLHSGQIQQKISE